MKIVSLLPSATEIVCALGLGDALKGVSSDCDHPAEVRHKLVVSGTALPNRSRLSAREIDDAVSAMVRGGEAIYTLDADRIRAIRPDLIVAQDLCRVCAVPSGAVEDALAVLGCTAQVISLDPSGLDDVIACIGVVGEATGTAARAAALMAELRARVERVRDRVAGRPHPRTLALEWSDPPFSGGHWVPDMVTAAGGDPVLAVAGEPSRRLRRAEIAAVSPEVVVFMPCGYGLDDAIREGEGLRHVPELSAADRIYAVHADAYFSRPGPRVVDGVEILAALLHPEVAPTAPAGTAARLR